MTNTAAADPVGGPSAEGTRSGGLRERKKARTRRAIQAHTLRLIEEQGYAATTVEQIAEAAEISPSTFFRYFRNKEDAAVADFMDASVFDQVMVAPEGLSLVEALRHGIHSVMEGMSDEEWQHEMLRSRLLSSVPELRRELMEEMVRPMRMSIQGAARRFGLSQDSLEARVFGGALVGGLFGVLLPQLDEVRQDLPVLVSRAEVIAMMDEALTVLARVLVPPV